MSTVSPEARVDGTTFRGPSKTIGAGRYAPSPTGELHLGNLRTAVLAWLFVRSTGRSLRLRIEDLDASRVRPGLAHQQQADLTALGVTFDGPVMIQSQRDEFDDAALTSLRDHTDECFCTRREIAGPLPPPRSTAALSRDLSRPHRRATGHGTGDPDIASEDPTRWP